MSAIAKEQPHSVQHLAAELFERLGALFAKPRLPSAKSVSAEVEKSVRQLRNKGSVAELKTLRDTVQELAAQMDQLVPCAQDAPGEAAHQDALGDALLTAAQGRGPTPMSTPKSIREGEAALALAGHRAAESVQARIASGELISSGELQRALDVKRQAVSGAVKAGRMFAIVGPSGDNFYPAFYADPALDRRALEKVTRALGSLPAASKYYFFTRTSTLLQETPLQALRKGRVAEVLAAAAGFAES